MLTQQNKISQTKKSNLFDTYFSAQTISTKHEFEDLESKLKLALIPTPKFRENNQANTKKDFLEIFNLEMGNSLTISEQQGNIWQNLAAVILAKETSILPKQFKLFLADQTSQKQDWKGFCEAIGLENHLNSNQENISQEKEKPGIINWLANKNGASWVRAVIAEKFTQGANGNEMAWVDCQYSLFEEIYNKNQEPILLVSNGNMKNTNYNPSHRTEKLIIREAHKLGISVICINMQEDELVDKTLEYDGVITPFEAFGSEYNEIRRTCLLWDMIYQLVAGNIVLGVVGNKNDGMDLATLFGVPVYCWETKSLNAKSMPTEQNELQETFEHCVVGSPMLKSISLLKYWINERKYAI